MSTKINTFKQNLHEWSVSCTFHCYPKCFQYKNKQIRVVWMLLFLIFSCFTCMLVYKCLTDYFQYEVVSKIQVVKVDQLTFPAVTICDSSPFTTKQAEAYIQNELYQNKSSDFTYILQYSKFLAAALNDSFKKSLGLNLKNSLVYCSFSLKACEYNKDFTWFYSEQNGNCFQFNSAAMKLTKFKGENHGFALMLNSSINQNRKYSLTYIKGLKVFIEDQSYEPLTMDNSVLVEAGKQTNIVIKKTVSLNQPKPYSNCDEVILDENQSELIEIIKKSEKKYLQNNCFIFCFQKMIIEKCDCHFGGMPVLLKNTKPCSNLSQFECYNNVSDIYVNRIQEFTKICSQDCPLECETISFEVQLSSTALSLKLQFEALINDEESMKKLAALYNESLTYELYKDSFVFLKIFYPSMEYTEIIQSPKTTIIELISNMGGALGIFLGFSIFSLVEVIELALQSFQIFLAKIKN